MIEKLKEIEVEGGGETGVPPHAHGGVWGLPPPPLEFLEGGRGYASGGGVVPLPPQFYGGGSLLSPCFPRTPKTTSPSETPFEEPLRVLLEVHPYLRPGFTNKKHSHLLCLTGGWVPPPPYGAGGRRGVSCLWGGLPYPPCLTTPRELVPRRKSLANP